MGGELLQLLEAEDSADATLAQAQARKEQAIAQALERRDARLSAIRSPILPPPAPRRQPDRSAKLRTAARKNMRKAVHLILEAMHAPA